MANISFKTIQFPGLSNVYTVPQIDNTNTIAGKAADAKKTGDDISQLKADLDNNVNDLKSAINGIEYTEGDAVAEYASATAKQAYYNTQYGLMGIRASTNFNYHVYEVSAGETYYVTGYGKSGVNDPIAVLVGSFIESGTARYIDKIDAQTASNANATVEYTPSADGYLYVNGFAQSDKAEMRDAVPNAKIARQIMSDMYVHRNGNLIEVMSKYSAVNDVIYLFDSVGPNSIMQIAGYDKLPNTEMYCSGDFSATRTHILQAGTDWMSPYKVIAVNNVDGDGAGQGVNGYYTGGFHAYDNSQSGVATGRTSAYKLFIDNKEITDTANKVYKVTDRVTLEVTNLIQGNNTTKADGTGRAILQEKITYTITQNRIDIVNTITALEDIVISQYYGLQLYLGALGGFSGFSYYGDTVESHNFSVATSYTKEIDSLIGGLNGDANRIVCQLDKKGIGRHQYIKSGGIMARSIAGRKVYNSLIDNSPYYLPLSTGDSVFISGHYAFSENTVNA